MVKASLINILLGPITIHGARAMAKKRGSIDFFHQGVAVYCAEEHAEQVKCALDDVVQFFGASWKRYRKNLRRIIVDPEVSSTLWFASRSLLIREDDASRMHSVEQMAGWLVADYERIQVLRRKLSLHVILSARFMTEANERGVAMRQVYIKTKQEPDKTPASCQ